MENRNVNKYYSPGRYAPQLSFLILENYFHHPFLRSSVSFGSPACSYIWVLIRSFLFSNRAMTVESQLSAMKSEEIERERVR